MCRNLEQVQTFGKAKLPADPQYTIAALTKALEEATGVLEFLIDPDNQDASAADAWAKCVAAARKGRTALTLARSDG